MSSTELPLDHHHHHQLDIMDPEKEREKAEKLLSQQLRTHFKSKTITEYLESYSKKPIDKVDLGISHASNSNSKNDVSLNGSLSMMSPTQPQEKLSNLTLDTTPSSTSPSPMPEKRERDGSSSDSPTKLIKKLGRGARRKELKLRHDVNYISQLMELTQAMGWASPRYEHTCVGNAHAQLFNVQCHVKGLEFHADKNTSKLQIGKENASLQALKYLFSEQG